MSFAKYLYVYAGAAAVSSLVRTVSIASTENVNIKVNGREASTTEKFGIGALLVLTAPITEPFTLYALYKAQKEGSFQYKYINKDE